MKPFQLLIKPVSFDCNLRCKYCFYLRVANEYPKIKHPRMSNEVLEHIIAQFLQFRFNESIFGWQGGEPTLAGLNFFKKVVSLQQKYGETGQIIGNAFQTNGILINDEWGRFFNRYRFLIGLSLDGPKDIHDRYRKSIGDKSVWQKVMNATECLKQNRVEFNILCVVSKVNVNRAKEVYKFFLDNDFTYLQFIPVLELGENGKKAPFSINPTQYGKFLCQLFDEWIKNPIQASIRTFNGILAYYHSYPKGYCTMEKECADYILIEWNGDVYPCDFFVQQTYKLGNILEENLSNLKNKRDHSFKKLKVKLDEDCISCSWLELCYGGCIKDRIFPDNPHPGKTYFCKAYKMFYQHSKNWFLTHSKEI
ncbi:MAG: anaerobic sulfatase maturase [Candidatus Hodarchaeota archaeon]